MTETPTGWKSIAERAADPPPDPSEPEAPTGLIKAGGALPQPIKKWGGGYDEDFQNAAYKLKIGDLSEPVRSSYGYHVILCTEENPPTTRELDWESDRYAEWILEEYEPRSMKQWLKTLKNGIKITLLPTSDLVGLKNISFPKRK